MNEYPRDEFDDVSEHTRREGAHRSFVQLRDPRTGLWALIVCGVLALIVGVLMFTVVKPWAASTMSTASESTSSAASSSGASGAASASSSAASTPASTPASSAPSSAVASTSESSDAASSEAASETPDPSSTPPSTSAAAADTSTKVGVYNGTAVSGLAQGSAATLTGAGYASVRTDNWTRKASTSTVYYKTAADQATAEDVAGRLGISSVMQVANIPRSVSVVLGSDQLSR